MTIILPFCCLAAEPVCARPPCPWNSYPYLPSCMQSASALTFDEMQQLSYKEVKGTGKLLAPSTLGTASRLVLRAMRRAQVVVPCGTTTSLQVAGHCSSAVGLSSIPI